MGHAAAERFCHETYQALLAGALPPEPKPAAARQPLSPANARERHAAQLIGAYGRPLGPGFAVWLEQRGLAVTTRRGVLQAARKMDPAAMAGVKLPALPRHASTTAFSPDEARRILVGFLEGDRWDRWWIPFVNTLFLAGLRPSEAIGLTWEDVEPGRLRIRRTLRREAPGVSWRRQEAPTKTRATRVVPISRDLYDLIQAGRGRHPELAFCTPRSRGPVDDRMFAQRPWRRVLARVGVRYRSPYAARHSAATLWLAQGHNPADIAQALGHSPEVLLATYAGCWGNLPPLRLAP